MCYSSGTGKAHCETSAGASHFLMEYSYFSKNINKMLKKLIELVNKKKDYFIFASRKERTENNILKALNQFRLFT